MTMTHVAQTTIRPARELLEGRLAAPRALSSVTAELDLLEVQQARIGAETAALIARMEDTRLTAAGLDRLTGRIAGLLQQAEDVRAARARAAARRTGDESRWLEFLETD